jgi:DNA mismatch repair protein MSH2
MRDLVLNKSFILAEYELKDALASCACIIKYLQLLGNEQNFGKFTLKHHDLSQYMRLDGPALAALNLLPTAQDGPSKNTSLYGLLNRCRTAQGSRLFAQWLKQPLLSLDQITRRQDIVQAFVENTELRQMLQEVDLNHIPDLHRLGKRFLKGNATLQDVVRIYQMVIRLPHLIQRLEESVFSDAKVAELIREIYTTKITECYGSLQKLEDLVVTTIDLEALDRHEYIIKAEFNEELKGNIWLIWKRIYLCLHTFTFFVGLHAGLKSLEKQMNEEHERVCDKLNLEIDKKLKLERHSMYGYCFRVIGRTESSKIRNKNEYFEFSTQKSGTYFSTSTLKALSSSYSELSISYDEKQRGLVKEVIDIVGKWIYIRNGDGDTHITL